MSDQQDATELQPETVHILETILRTPQALRLPVPPLPDREMLIRYLCGALAAEPARQVECSLIATSSVRQQLRTANTALLRLQALPWNTVRHLASASDDSALTAQVWLKIASEQSDALARVSTAIHSLVWDALIRRLQESAAEAHAFRLACAVLQTQVKLGRSLAGNLPASAKGARSGQTLEADSPDNVEFQLTGSIQADGALQASLTFLDARAFAVSSLSGQTASLALDINGTWISLAAAEIADGKAEWNVAGIGTALGLPAGAVPPALMHVSMGDNATPLEKREHLILAEVVDSAGKSLAEHTIRLELHGKPNLQSQQLQVTLSVDPVTRMAYRLAMLALEIPIGEQQWQTLASWPLSEWTDAPRSLNMDYPGNATEEAVLLAPFRIRLYLP